VGFSWLLRLLLARRLRLSTLLLYISASRQFDVVAKLGFPLQEHTSVPIKIGEKVDIPSSKSLPRNALPHRKSSLVSTDGASILLFSMVGYHISASLQRLASPTQLFLPKV
jgi:hypothetical protein